MWGKVLVPQAKVASRAKGPKGVVACQMSYWAQAPPGSAGGVKESVTSPLTFTDAQRGMGGSNAWPKAANAGASPRPSSAARGIGKRIMLLRRCRIGTCCRRCQMLIRSRAVLCVPPRTRPPCSPGSALPAGSPANARSLARSPVRLPPGRPRTCRAWPGRGRAVP
jgi:hypothetical protein